MSLINYVNVYNVVACWKEFGLVYRDRRPTTGYTEQVRGKTIERGHNL